MRTSVGVLALLWAFLGVGCSGPTVAAFGESDDLVVVREEGALGRAEALLLAALEAEVPWLIGEGAFRVTVTTPEEFRRLTNRRHILLVGTWEDAGVVELVRTRVGGLEPGRPPALRVVEDIWAEGQIVGAMMGDSGEALARHLEQNGEAVASELETAAVARLARTLRDRAEAGGLPARLEGRFGWSLSPPSGYDFITTHADAGFVFFRRTRPDRSIFVQWQPGRPEDVTSEYATTKRAALAARYYDGDEIEWRREFTAEETDFNGRPAVRLSGWWGNRELVGGGPFRTYCLYDDASGRVYLIDASLFAPGLDKVPLMRNLEASLQTFRTASR